MRGDSAWWAACLWSPGPIRHLVGVKELKGKKGQCSWCVGCRAAHTGNSPAPSCSMRLGQNRKALLPALFGNVDLALGAVTEEKLTVPYTPVWWGDMWPSIFTYMKKNVALLGNPCNK